MEVYLDAALNVMIKIVCSVLMLIFVPCVRGGMGCLVGSVWNV